MCGLFGAFSTLGKELSREDVRWFARNARIAERRGSDASGLVRLDHEGRISYAKAWLPVSQLLRQGSIEHEMGKRTATGWFGHSRLETHGFSADETNNQPMVSDDWFVLHNGIVTNHEELRAEWAENERVQMSQSDSYVILVLLEMWHASGRSQTMEDAVFGRCEGELTVIAGSRFGDLLIFTNVGNLYMVQRDDGVVLLGSEPRQFGRHLGQRARQIDRGVTTLRRPVSHPAEPVVRLDVDLPRRRDNGADGLHVRTGDLSGEFRSLVVALAAMSEQKMNSMRRCSRCLLPESFPGIRFDDGGLCSVCNAFSPPRYEGLEALERDLKKASPNGRDVLVCLSGGRDSCYVLHLIDELGFRPTAYTYDWGMVTTAARENMAKMCGKLGVEHVLVSPDIQRNRLRVRHALLAWLRSPDIATIPILMAGDKPYFRYAGIVADERGGLPAVMADHHLETTGFKSMLAGAVPSKGSTGGVEYRLSGTSLMRMARTYALSGVRNPKMARSIMVEGGIGFIDYYLRKHKFVRPFMYVPWDERRLEETLVVKYQWSKGLDADLPSWRMGDATAPFYNLVYCLALGMTEHDALRSNQIRYGLLSREDAAELLAQDNKVSALGLATYFFTAGLSEKEAIGALHQLKTLA